MNEDKLRRMYNYQVWKAQTSAAVMKFLIEMRKIDIPPNLNQVKVEAIGDSKYQRDVKIPDFLLQIENGQLVHNHLPGKLSIAGYAKQGNYGVNPHGGPFNQNDFDIQIGCLRIMLIYEKEGCFPIRLFFSCNPGASDPETLSVKGRIKFGWKTEPERKFHPVVFTDVRHITNRKDTLADQRITAFFSPCKELESGDYLFSAKRIQNGSDNLDTMEWYAECSNSHELYAELKKAREEYEAEQQRRQRIDHIEAIRQSAETTKGIAVVKGEIW